MTGHPAPHCRWVLAAALNHGPDGAMQYSNVLFLLFKRRSPGASLRVTDKGQVTMLRRIRLAAGVLRGGEVTFATDALLIGG